VCWKLFTTVDGLVWGRGRIRSVLETICYSGWTGVGDGEDKKCAGNYLLQWMNWCRRGGG
jgi:hypothetical protein